MDHPTADVGRKIHAPQSIFFVVSALLVSFYRWLNSDIKKAFGIEASHF
jgi:hypothetical protein